MNGCLDPLRRAVLTASMATLPPPMTATRSPRSMRLTQVDAQQKVHTGPDPFDLFSFDAQQFALLGADGHEKGAVSLVAQMADGRVRTEYRRRF
jgi:hypothetical protein